MNTIEALRILVDIADVPVRLSFNPATFEAHKVIVDLLAAYDALVPPLDLWPEDAEWFTIDADGITHFSEMEPMDHHLAFWIVRSGKFEISFYAIVDSVGERRSLPPGIDWRLCKWQRPEVTDA